MDQGYLYGYGVFETINVVASKVIFFAEHMKRLKSSSAVIGLQVTFDEDRILRDCNDMIKKNLMEIGALRVTHSKGSAQNNLIITARENHYGEKIVQKGLNINISDYRRNEKSLLVTVKSNNYLENLLILNRSINKGFSEAIFFNSQGYLAEGCISNIFFIKNKKVHTPAADNGLLSGIVRNKVIELLKVENIPIEEGYYSKASLLAADEIFITNSLMEIMPVNRVGHQPFFLENESFTNHIRALYKQRLWV
ncbi:aminotransferase class IV [Acetobacterium bakii]|uniref:aminotransferase class IV n=1 Tax=Acetobacterium bakii TaxID=52689 RepID=UPI0006833ECF|nr:aminotransferase class IV [Acetobacterium bakii]